MAAKKKPINQHIQDGTFRSDRHLPDALENYVEAKPTVPTPPGTLSEIGKKHWYLIVSEMVKNRIYTDGDSMLVESLCMKLDIQERAYTALQSESLVLDMVNHKGTGYKVINPYSTILNTITADIIKISAQLGLSPESRTRIGVSRSDKEDPLIRFIKR